jgi:hypothetical protein
MNLHHNFNKVLHVKGQYSYCSKCGLVRLGNRASIKAENKPCRGLRDLEDEEYLRVKKMIGG